MSPTSINHQKIKPAFSSTESEESQPLSHNNSLNKNKIMSNNTNPLNSVISVTSTYTHVDSCPYKDLEPPEYNSTFAKPFAGMDSHMTKYYSNGLGYRLIRISLLLAMVGVMVFLGYKTVMDVRGVKDGGS